MKFHTIVVLELMFEIVCCLILILASVVEWLVVLFIALSPILYWMLLSIASITTGIALLYCYTKIRELFDVQR